MRDTRLFIQKQLKIADEAFVGGDPQHARTIRDELIQQYKDYPYLKDLIDTIPNPAAGTPPNPPASAAPGAESHKPSSSPDPIPASGSPPARPAVPAGEEKSEPAKPDESPRTPDSRPPEEVDQHSGTEFRSYDWSLIDGPRPVR
jgi:hypothetical protein